MKGLIVCTTFLFILLGITVTVGLPSLGDVSNSRYRDIEHYRRVKRDDEADTTDASDTTDNLRGTEPTEEDTTGPETNEFNARDTTNKLNADNTDVISPSPVVTSTTGDETTASLRQNEPFSWKPNCFDSSSYYNSEYYLYDSSEDYSNCPDYAEPSKPSQQKASVKENTEPSDLNSDLSPTPQLLEGNADGSTDLPATPQAPEKYSDASVDTQPEENPDGSAETKTEENPDGSAETQPEENSDGSAGPPETPPPSEELEESN